MPRERAQGLAGGDVVLARVEAALAAVTAPPCAPVAVVDAPLIVQGGDVLRRAAALLGPMAEALAQCVPEKLAEECRAVAAAQVLALEGSGVAAYLSWKAFTRALPPLDLSRWARPDCPACGAQAAMAVLRETDRGRERVLLCGRCATQWPWRRIGCPSCGCADALSVLEPEGEPGVRADVCGHCGAYLKTFVGEGVPDDVSTLYIDAACAARGLRRAGPSLYCE